MELNYITELNFNIINIKENILEFLLRNKDKSFKATSIFKRLDLRTTHRGSFRSGLQSLLNEGLITKDGKYYAAGRADGREEIPAAGRKSLNIRIGTIDYGKDGRNIVKITESDRFEDMLKISNPKGHKLRIGDKVEYKLMMSEENEEIAKIISIIDARDVKFAGRFEDKRKYGIISPDSREVRRDVYVLPKYFGGAKHGDKVFARLDNPADLTDENAELTAKIEKVLGKPGEKDTEEKSIMLQYGLVKTFPKNVLSEAKSISGEINSDGRLDLRDKIIFTIDPEDAKDFDDAVSIETLDDGTYMLGVHIADVSHYVEEGSALDAEALKRATSVYLVRNVIPMLPERLSNDLCSLKPNEDRPAFSIFIHLSKRFAVKGYELAETIINSKRRFTYEEAQKVMDTGKGDFNKELRLMHRISKSITMKRLEEESLDFDSNEVKFKFDKSGNITDIVVKHRLESMRLIEEFMLLANKCATLYVNKLSKEIRTPLPFVYRVHDVPNKEKLEELAEFVKQFGYSLKADDKNSLRKLLDGIKDTPEEFIINDLLIRSMAKAIYSPRNIGHYGLGFHDYTHFTSPIRRYPDLIVHRLLKKYLKPNELSNSFVESVKKGLPDLCRHCSIKEQNAEISERESIKLTQTQYIGNHIGDEFDGIISSVVHFGMFVEIMDILVEGMIRFRDLDDDYYDFDERRKIATGRRRGRTYRAGQKVRVQVIRANMETRKIDFALIS